MSQNLLLTTADVNVPIQFLKDCC